MNIYKSMGFEWLLEEATWAALDEHISENTRYVIPGYACNYRFCSFPGYIEFNRCESLDGISIKTDMHFSANHHWKLEADSIISDDSSTPVYAFKSAGGEIIPVRIVCPDVLPAIDSGKLIEGQVVAFADSIVKVSENSLPDYSVSKTDDECSVIKGVITDVNLGKFIFNDIESSFWELDVECENGEISVLIAEDGIDFIPEQGNAISAHAMISMDIAIDYEVMNPREKAFYESPYTDVIGKDENYYRNGFRLDFHNNQQVLVNCIKAGSFDRFARCCLKTLEFTDVEGITCSLDKDSVIVKIEKLMPEDIDSVEVKHILSCDNEAFLGHDAVVISTLSGKTILLWFDIAERGAVSQVALLNPETCTWGIDNELHLYAMFAHALCNKKWYVLQEYISENCLYQSEYGNASLSGAKNIVKRTARISRNLSPEYAYTYKISFSEDELAETEDIPLIYRRNRCVVVNQSGKLAYIAFLTINKDNQISNIFLSCNSECLRRFATKTSSKVDPLVKHKSVREILTSVYGNEDTLAAMRKNEIPENDVDGVYIWKKADEFTKDWLRDNEYNIMNSVLVDDCLGYACQRRGLEYAVFCYAYGESKTTLLDGDYCAKLRDEETSQGREIIIIYLRVDKEANETGEIEYKVGRYGDADKNIEPWLLTTVNDKNILRFYPRKELMDLTPRLISAYNNNSYDELRVLFTDNVFLDAHDSDGHSMNDGFYSHLSYIRETYGEMKLAYIRFTDVVYCEVPCIENYAYITFSAKDKIDKLEMKPLNETYRELMILENGMDRYQVKKVPFISEVQFLKPSDISRFSLRITFENGEIRRYDFPGEYRNDEVVHYQRRIMTDKIFANGRLTEHLPMPEWMGYRNYVERGQGIEFVSGATISAEALYYDSYPIEKFSYAGIGNVHIMQMDYAEDGFGVGYISNMDPKNPTYLLDKNTMTARVIPDEYQNTRIGIYPYYGGYSEGLVMVSKYGDLDLQYHHNRGSCAGLWGWLDKNLEVVIEPKYIYAMNFVDGRAIVCKGDWDVIDDNGKEQYWCDNEKWGVIDQTEKEIVPCRFDELYEIENTNRLYFVHEGGWDDGHYAVFDVDVGDIILELDFDFDIGYMFNECFVADGDILVFDNHLPGEGKDLIYAYDLIEKKYIAHGDPVEGRTYNGETKAVVNKDGEDIIIF